MFVFVKQSAVSLQATVSYAFYFLWRFWVCCWSLCCRCACGGTTKVCFCDLFLSWFHNCGNEVFDAAQLGYISMTTDKAQLRKLACGQKMFASNNSDCTSNLLANKVLDSPRFHF